MSVNEGVVTPLADVRLVATDLDGTLLGNDGVCSPRTRAALAAVEDAGIQVVMVTARPPRWLHGLADVVGEHGLALCANGAFVYDVRSQQVLREHCLEGALVRDIAIDLRRALPEIVFAVETRIGFSRELGYLDDFTAPSDASAVTIEGLLDPAPGKILARCGGMPADLLHSVITDVVGDRAVVSYSGATGLAEISAAGVTKAAALGDWCAIQGIDAADVIAFGDMPNDLPMLAWAGRCFGVANAHPDVLAMVDEVCASNEENGVAQVLEALLEARRAALAVGTSGTGARILPEGTPSQF